MAKLKQYNQNTKQYDDTNICVLSLKDTLGIESAYTVYPMSEYASHVSSNDTSTTYTLNNLVKGDTITFKRSYNGQAQSNLINNPNGEVTETATWEEFTYGTIVLENDYATLTVTTYDVEFAKVYQRKEAMVDRPSYYDEFIPTINDEESNVLKTLSSQKIYELYGKNAIDMLNALNDKTIIFMGDSYTKGATNQFKALCEKYGATADNRGIVSSSICGNVEGTQGFQPMWNRVNNLCDEYVTNGTTANVGAVVFMGGANDGFGKQNWLGSGINDKNTNHIYGALHSIYRKFRDTFDCPIFTILQPYFPNGSTPSGDITEETAIALGFESVEQCLTFDSKEYCAYSMNKKQTVVKEMANFYNSQVVDCCFDWHSIFRASDSKYWSSDGHPTALGYQEIANDLEQAMLEYEW